MPKPDPKDKILRTLFPPLSQRGDETKLRMVNAAVDILSNEGIEALTFEAVGKRVGMNKAQVRYHFPSKDILIDKSIEYVLTTVQETMVEHVARAHTVEEHFSAMATGFLTWSENHQREARVYLLFYYLAARVPKYKKLHTDIILAGRNRFAGMLSGAKEGKRWSRSEIDTLTSQFWAILDGFTLYFVTMDPSKAPKPKEALQLIEILLDAKLRS